jgi:hypothetical protein
MARWLSLGVLGITLTLVVPQPALGSAWTVSVQSGSAGESGSAGLPSAPAGPGASCTSSIGNTVTITWSLVTHASSYSVYQATNGASGPYTLSASGITAATWTSPGLALGNYWFEVAAVAGSHWQGPNSGATGETTILLVACTQP